MKSQGTDGLSRGDSTSGVMAGEEFLSHVPLNLGAFDRHPPFKTWLKDMLPGNDWIFLDEKGWYQQAFEDPKGKYVWAPPPCVADVCLEQLSEVRHIHPDASHVFVCPALMTIKWRKQLAKQSDSMCTVKEGAPIWPLNMLEPVVISLTAPLLPHNPVVDASEQMGGFSEKWFARSVPE